MLLLSVILLALQVVSDSGAGPPDMKGFTSVLSEQLKFQIDDYKTAFVGRKVVYQNSNNLNEFVCVYYRQVVIISERAQERDTSEADSRDTNLSNLKYHSQEEAEALRRVQQATDAFAYVQWRTVRDSRTGQDIRNGVFLSWLLGQNGNWTSSSDHNLLTSPFSESSNDDPKKRIIVGIRFTLVGGVHIVRIDQDDVTALVKEVTNEKK